MEAMLLGKADTPPETPAPAPEPEKPEPAKADPPADPVKELSEEDPTKSKLPIEEEEEPASTEPEPTGDKAGKRIQALKEEIKTIYKPKLTELETTLQTKEARIAELEATAAKTVELEEKIAQYEKEMSVVRLEQMPEFQELVTKPLKEMSDKVASIAEAYEIDTAKLVAAVAEPDETKRRALFKDLTSGVDVDVEDQIALRNIATKTHEIYAKEDELYKNADGALAELAARREGETAAQAAARAEERAKASEVAASAITKALPFLNELMPDITKKVKDTPLETLDPTRAAYNAIAGEILPKVKKQLTDLTNERDSLLDELSSYRKATPRVGGTMGSTPTSTKHTDLASALMAGAGLIGQ
jgi:hypothetical protein